MCFIIWLVADRLVKKNMNDTKNKLERNLGSTAKIIMEDTKPTEIEFNLYSPKQSVTILKANYKW